MTPEDVDGALATIPSILEKQGLTGTYSVTSARVRVEVGKHGDPGFRVFAFDIFQMVEAVVTLMIPPPLPSTKIDPPAEKHDVVAILAPKPAAEPPKKRRNPFKR